MSPQAKHQRMYRGASLHSEASQVELDHATTHKTSAVVVSPEEDTSGYDSSFVKGLLEAERKQMLDEQRSSFKGAKVSFMGDLRTWTTSPYQKYERKIFKGGCTIFLSVVSNGFFPPHNYRIRLTRPVTTRTRVTKRRRARTRRATTTNTRTAKPRLTASVYSC